MTLDWFVANQSYIAIYTPPAGSDPARIVDFARQSHARYIRFDPWFDLGDASRMYCTEFVALALAAGDAPPVRTSAMNRNPSLRVLTDWLQLRADTIIPAAALIEHGERVALISRDYSPAQFTAYFALKQELHRRFTPDQKIGNVLSFSTFTRAGLPATGRRGDPLGRCRRARLGQSHGSVKSMRASGRSQPRNLGQVRVRPLSTRKIGSDSNFRSRV